MIMEFVMLNGIGSMPEIIAANVAWIWSVLKPNKNMNGSNKRWEVSTTLNFLDYAHVQWSALLFVIKVIFHYFWHKYSGHNSNVPGNHD